MFKDKYPAVSALILLMATGLKDAVKAVEPGQSLLAKLAEFSNLGTGVVAFIPNAGSLSSELAAIKASSAEVAQAVEMLISDLEFSNEHAQKVIGAAFPVLEDLAAIEPKVVALVEAIKG